MKKHKLTTADLHAIASFNKIVMNYLKMKRLLTLLILLMVVCSGATTAQTVKIVYPGFTSYWNPDTLIPDSVIFIAKPHEKVVGREAGFHADGKVPNMNRDYAHSGYDIGHLCDASDENWDKTDEFNSFSYCNVFPQRPNCNRLVWLQLENQVRKLADQYGQIKNKVYWIGISGHIGKDRVTVPMLCIKEIWYGGIHEKYVIPNCDSVSKHDYTFYKQ